MTRPDLDAIEARERAATPGPWSAEGDEIRADGALVLAVWAEHAHDYGLTATAEDLVFIANARVDIPTLTARVRELEAAALDLLTRLDADCWIDDDNRGAWMDARDRLRALAAKETP